MGKEKQRPGGPNVVTTYAPSEREAAALAAHRQRRRAAPARPPLKYESGKGFRVDHADEVIGGELLTAASGFTNGDALENTLTHLARFCDNDPATLERQLNGIIATMVELRPRDQVEGMLAAQMAVTHELTLLMARRLARAESIPQQDSAERALNKLGRTFTAQIEALRRHRHGGQQKVTVEHVTVNEGGQAIVGNVETGGHGRKS